MKEFIKRNRDKFIICFLIAVAPLLVASVVIVAIYQLIYQTRMHNEVMINTARWEHRTARWEH